MGNIVQLLISEEIGKMTSFSLDVVTLILGTISAIVGIISAVWYFWEKLFPMRKIGWSFAEKTAKKIGQEMTADDFSPTLIVGIGRGGAVMGALISGALGHRPLVVIDRKYMWIEGDRIEDMIFPMSIPQDFLERVLLVSGEVHSGNTMKVYYQYFQKLGARSIRKATLYYEKGATVGVEYKGLESAKKNIMMPWMSKQYIRADRAPPRTASSRKSEL